MKRHYTANFKAQVVQELLKEEKTMAQIAGRYREGNNSVDAGSKKNLELNLSRDERLRLIERESEELSVRIQVELLSVSRSGVYYHPQAPSEAEVQLKHRIDEIYTKWPFYGSRKITAHLQLEGVEVNRKAIERAHA